MNVTKSDDENACVLASLTVSARSMERCAPFLPGIGPAEGAPPERIVCKLPARARVSGAARARMRAAGLTPFRTTCPLAGNSQVLHSADSWSGHDAGDEVS